MVWQKKKPGNGNQGKGQGEQAGGKIESHHDGTKANQAKPEHLLNLQPTFKTASHRNLIRVSPLHCNLFLVMASQRCFHEGKANLKTKTGGEYKKWSE